MSLVMHGGPIRGEFGVEMRGEVILMNLTNRRVLLVHDFDISESLLLKFLDREIYPDPRYSEPLWVYGHF